MTKPTGDWRPDPTASVDDWVGQTLDRRYQVSAQLGAGGMGFVYKARDKRLGIDVVIKAPRPEMLPDPEFRQRFRDEITALVQLSHPHIVKVSDVGNHGKTPFAVMQYLSGGSMDDRRPREANGRTKPVAPRTLMEWLAPVAEALDFIHAQGYVHRDIKPANILFDAHKHAFVSDFGVAKALAAGAVERRGLTGAGMVLGTPEYLAPEVILGRPFDGRIDQYALAITVYELLSGTQPFTGPTGPAILVKQTAETAKPLHELRPTLRPALAAVIGTAMAKNPAERFGTCTKFAQAVLGAIGESARVSPPSAPTKHARPASPVAETPRATKTSAVSPFPPLESSAPPTRRGFPWKWMVASIAIVVAVVAVYLSVGAFDKPKRGSGIAKRPEDKAPASVPSKKPEPVPVIVLVPTPAPQQPTVHIAPKDMQLIAGEGKSTVTVTLDGPLQGTIAIDARGFRGIVVDPQRASVHSERRSATFTVSASETAPADGGTIQFEYSGQDVSGTGAMAVSVRQPDFAVQRQDPAPIVARPGQAVSVSLVIDRGGGYRGRVLVEAVENSLCEAFRTEVAAGATEVAIDLKIKKSAALGSGSIAIRAAGRPITHEVATPIQIVDFQRSAAFNLKAGAAVTALALDRSGQLLICGSEDGVVRLASATSGTEMWKQSRHKKSVRSAAFRSDNSRLLTGSDDGIAFVWARIDGKEINKLAGAHGTRIWNVYFTPSGPRPAPFTSAKSRLINPAPVTIGSDYRALWDDYAEEPLLERVRTSEPLEKIRAVLPNGALSLSGHGSDVLQVWRGEAVAATLSGNGGGIVTMSLSGNDKCALTLGADGALRIWDVSSGRLLAGGAWKPPNGVTAAVMMADGLSIYCGDSTGQVTLWSLP